MAVIGAGGIGVDVSHWLSHTPGDAGEDLEDWLAHWGVGGPDVHFDDPVGGGLTERRPRTPAREVYLVQRKTSVIGKDLGKTSGWAHRAVLKQSGVEQISGASYDRIDERGLHLTVDGEPRLLEVDDVVVCAGQESVRSAVRRPRAGRPTRDEPQLPSHRRCRRGRRARREAGHRAGDAGGRRRLTSAMPPVSCCAARPG